MIRVILPQHLRTLAGIEGELQLKLPEPVTLGATLDQIEAKYPMLRGTIRDPISEQRRPFVRFFACKEDLSENPPETVLPEAIHQGTEPFMIIGAMAGG